MQSINQKTHFKKVRQGLSIYKTGQSQYYFARIWLSKEKRYTVKTTKETSRLDALEVAEEIFEKLKQNKVSQTRRWAYLIDLYGWVRNSTQVEMVFKYFQ